MQTRFFVVLAALVVLAFMLPVGGCGDNDNSGPPPCCPVCGDGVCSGDEGTCDCRQDCRGAGVICPLIVPTCGDGACERAASPGESHESCPRDCRLACRECRNELDVYVDGRVSRGTSCPPGTTVAYRDGSILACNSCVTNADCESDEECLFHCGPGCENDTLSCCAVHGCIEVVR